VRSQCLLLAATLTLGRFSRLIVDYDADKPTLAGVRSDDTVVPVDGMSEGTVDQLYLALRVAAVEDVVRGGVRLPFLDDLFLNFDDERAAAGFKVFAQLGVWSRTGSPWRDLDERYGPYTTIYNRYNRWAKAGVWLKIFETLAAQSPQSMQMIDSSIIRAHQHAAGGKKGVRITPLAVLVED